MSNNKVEIEKMEPEGEWERTLGPVYRVLLNGRVLWSFADEGCAELLKGRVEEALLWEGAEGSRRKIVQNKLEGVNKDARDSEG